jgi:hypothetical protein
MEGLPGLLLGFQEWQLRTAGVRLCLVGEKFFKKISYWMFCVISERF